MIAPKRKEEHAKRRFPFICFRSLRTTITVTGIAKFRRPENFVRTPAANMIARRRGATLLCFDGARGYQKSRTLRCRIRILQNRESVSVVAAVLRNTKSGSEAVTYKKHIPDTL